MRRASERKGDLGQGLQKQQVWMRKWGEKRLDTETDEVFEQG
jgi:hypothetical protein